MGGKDITTPYPSERLRFDKQSRTFARGPTMGSPFTIGIPVAVHRHIYGVQLLGLHRCNSGWSRQLVMHHGLPFRVRLTGIFLHGMT